MLRKKRSLCKQILNLVLILHKVSCQPRVLRIMSLDKTKQARDRYIPIIFEDTVINISKKCQRKMVLGGIRTEVNLNRTKLRLRCYQSIKPMLTKTF